MINNTLLKQFNTSRITTLFSPSIIFSFSICSPFFTLASSVNTSAIDTPSEVILVTSQKRIENIQNIAVSVTALETSDIEVSGYRQLADISEFVPNLDINKNNDAGSIILLRGVGSASRNIGIDSRVGLYLDGVYLGQSIANNQDVFDLERIEVLRGPQGTLFGKNNISGAINIITKAPEKELSGRLGLSLGNYNLHHLNGAINVPISDNLRAKFSVNTYKRDGYIRNITTGNLLNEQDSESYRAIFSGELSQSVDFNLSIDQLKSDRLSYDGDPITDTFGNFIDTQAPEINSVSFNIDPTEKRKTGGEIFTVNWQLDNELAIKSITGHRYSENNFVEDFDFSTQEIATLDFFDEYEQYSQEFQLISPEDDFQYILGVYLYRQTAKTNNQISVFDDALTGFTGVARSDAEFLAANGDLTGLSLVNGFAPGNLNTFGEIDNDNIALFFNTNYQINKRLSLDLGLRYTYETIDVDWTISNIDNLTNTPVIPALAIANGNINDRQSYNDLSPLIALNYKINQYVNSYLKYSTGFKSGGYNLAFLTQDQFDSGIEFDEETVKSVELGFKGTAFDQALVYRSALFVANYDDFQVNQFEELGSGASVFSLRNAAEVSTKGVELELSYTLNDFEFTAIVALLDAEFDDFQNAGPGGQDLSGTSLPNVSDYTYNLGVNYYHYFSAISSDVRLALNYDFRSDYNSDLVGDSSITLADNSELAVGDIDGFGVVNFSVELAPIDSGLSLSFWVRNLANEDSAVRLGQRSFFGTRRNFEIEPRTAGITAQYTF